MRDLRDTATSRETGVNSRWGEENDGEHWGGLCPGATSCNRRCGAGGDPPPPPTAPTRHHRSPWSSWGARGIQHKKKTQKTTLFYSCGKISVTLFSCKVTYTKYDRFCSEGIEIKIES